MIPVTLRWRRKPRRTPIEVSEAVTTRSQNASVMHSPFPRGDEIRRKKDRDRSPGSLANALKGRPPSPVLLSITVVAFLDGDAKKESRPQTRNFPDTPLHFAEVTDRGLRVTKRKEERRRPGGEQEAECLYKIRRSRAKGRTKAGPGTIRTVISPRALVPARVFLPRRKIGKERRRGNRKEGLPLTLSNVAR